MVYIDTSVLVAYYYPEALSAKVDSILVKLEEPAISQLTEVELCSAIARKIRERSLSQSGGNKILSLFQIHKDQNSFIQLPLQSRHYSLATQWISQFNTPLRTLDALHLAIAEENNISILTADINLVKSAEHLGIEVTFVS